jgi:glycosyltransferase involved in cell wall biosynthesis
MKKLLLYGTTWRYPRNQLLLNSLKNFFNLKILTSRPIDNSISHLISKDYYFVEKFINYKSVGLSFCPNYKSFIEEFKPDFVLTVEPHTLSTLQSIYFKKKYKYDSIIFSWQNLNTIPKYYFQKVILKYNLKNSNYLIGGTRDVVNYFENYNINGDDFRNEWDFKINDKILLYAGRLHPEKGLKQILEVSKFYNDKIKFIFVGEGPYKDEIKKKSQKNILYFPKINYSDMPKLYRTADIVLYPSLTQKYWKEQFGYSVIEANACGKPVITTNSGSLRLIVKEGINGSNFNEGDINMFKNKIDFWLEKIKDEETKFKIKKYIEKFSNDNIAMIYNQILNYKSRKYKSDWI